MATDQVTDLVLGLVGTLRENSAVDPMDLLTAGCLGLPTVARAGLVLADPADGSVTAYATDDHARRLVERRDGPAFSCLRTGEALVFGHGCAMPMRCDGRTLGALAFVADPPPADGSLVRLGQTLADAAAIVIVIRREAARNRATVGQLQTALTSRIGIEQAKGVMAGKLGVDVDEAFRILREYARSNNRLLNDVAAEVVGGSADPAAIRLRVLSRQRRPTETG
jgi:hypothetical protein